MKSSGKEATKQVRERNKTAKDAVFAMCTIVGAVAGAGFLSGRELLEFYGGFRLLPLAASFTAFTCGFFLFLYLGARFGGFNGVMCELFQSGALAAKSAVLFCSFVVGVATLAALNAAYSSFKPFLSLSFVVIAVVFTRKGICGLSAFSAVFTPFLIVAVATLILFRNSFSPPERLDCLCATRFSFSAMIYASMNVLAACPVVCDLGETLCENRKSIAVALGSATVLTVLSAAILSVMGSEKFSYSQPLPLDFVLRGGSFFSALSLIGMLTTFTACFYPTAKAFEQTARYECGFEKSRRGAAENHEKNFLRNKTEIFSRLFVSALYLSASAASFEKIVRYFYPVAGALGATAMIAAFFLCFVNRRETVCHTA